MNGVESCARARVSVVVPVYNNADSLEELWRRLMDVFEGQGLGEYEIVFVDDGSRDDSREVLRRLCAKDARVRLIALSRNFGHQLAITAGFDSVKGDAVIVMDADLQDPPEVLPKFLAKWQEGHDVVYGVRLARPGDSTFKRWTASAFYRILRRMTNVEIALDSGDFRLLSRRAMDTFNRLRERRRFVRGMISWLGYPQTPVYYERAPRWAGESQYSLRRLVRLALDGIFSFSDVPLRMATWLGFAGAGASLVYLLFAVGSKLTSGVPLQGWTSLITVIVFIGSLQLIVLGVIGGYLGRMYEELKARPLYVIQERVGFDDEKQPVTT